MTEKFMKEAVELSKKHMENGDGGPFGCVIVKNKKIIGKGWNNVLKSRDPTAHAEMCAIRDACANLDTNQLEGCDIYSSCEPCPMCLGAIYWARPDRVFYANTREDAAALGFDDSFIYQEMKLPFEERKIPMIALDKSEAKKVFEIWKNKEGNTSY